MLTLADRVAARLPADRWGDPKSVAAFLEAVLAEADHREVRLDAAARVQELRVDDTSRRLVDIVVREALEKSEGARPADLEHAEAVGRLLAEAGVVLLTGGHHGVMGAAARGARGAGGTSIGLMPGLDRAQGTPDHTYLLPTGLGELRNGLLQGELRLHFQPQVSMRTGRVLAVEAVVRRQHATKGLLGADAVVPIAEKSGLIAEVDQRFREAVSVAERTAPPPLDSIFEDVYERPPWHLNEQRAELLSGPRAPGAHG